jgi:hypothetical protein
MTIDIFAVTAALSDRELLSRLELLAGQERATSAELIAHLAELDERPALFAAAGFSSLFAYCTEVLRLSEDAACARINVARVCRRFPAGLDLLSSGALTVTSLRMIGAHLTPENHEAILARATGLTRREMESLVAEIAPRPDVPSTVRKLPVSAHRPTPPASAPEPLALDASTPAPDDALPRLAAGATPAPPRADRPIVQATAPDRYRVQFTIGPEAHARFRRLQTVLRREIPSGDPAVIFDRAVALLLDTVEKKKRASTDRPRRPSTRPGTDRRVANAQATTDVAAMVRTPIILSRHVASEVKRAVWARDEARCAYVAPSGRRCGEQSFVELHHVVPYALDGPATAANISLRCRRHNAYESEQVFGRRAEAVARRRSASP